MPPRLCIRIYFYDLLRLVRSFMPTPLSNRMASTFNGLQRRSNRQRAQLSVLVGIRAVEAAVQGGATLGHVAGTDSALRDTRFQALRDALSGVPLYTADAETLDDLAPTANAQGLLATVRLPDLGLNELWESAETALVLDGVQDPGNVGTLIRTAAWFGVDAVVAGPQTAGLFHPAVLRAGMGGHWDVQLARSSDLGDAVSTARRQGFTGYGADLGGTPAQYWHPVRPSLLVIGSEAHGLSPALLGTLDEPVSVEGSALHPATESLNAAIAAGIVMHRWTVAAP